MYRVRLFVLWIMMFAVPLQGYAATAMVFCGPGHSSGATASPDHVQPGHGDGHDEATQPVAEDGAGKTAGTQPDAMHKCGICGACNIAALVSTPQWAVFHDLPPADIAEPIIVMAKLAPRVLDKPPRT